MSTHRPSSESHPYRRIFEAKEDERLRRLVDQYGTEDWSWIAAHMPNRTRRQCRERYKTYLCPEVNVSPWSEVEDRMLLAKYNEIGSKWAEFRPFFQRRTVNNIKNRWHTLVRRERLDGEKASSDAGEPAVANPLAVFQIANLLNGPAVC
jgi:hypothetical protein